MNFKMNLERYFKNLCFRIKIQGFKMWIQVLINRISIDKLFFAFRIITFGKNQSKFIFFTPGVCCMA